MRVLFCWLLLWDAMIVAFLVSNPVMVLHPYLILILLFITPAFWVLGAAGLLASRQWWAASTFVGAHMLGTFGLVGTLILSAAVEPLAVLFFVAYALWIVGTNGAVVYVAHLVLGRQPRRALALTHDH